MEATNNIRPIGTPTTDLHSDAELTPGFALALNRTAATLFEKLSERRTPKHQNFCFFTPNIVAAFAMLAAGAPESVKSHLEAFLNTQEVQGDYHHSYRQWLAGLSARSVAQASELGKTSDTAKQIFYRQAQAVLTRDDAVIPAETAERLGAYQPVQISFQNNAQAREFTNAWVEGQTDGKITGLVDSLPSETVMMLVTAALFQGNWKYPFKKSMNSGEVFCNADGTKVSVTMMNQGLDDLRMYSDWDAGVEVLELPYDGNVSMMFVKCGSGWRPNGEEMARNLASFMKRDNVEELLSNFDEKAKKRSALSIGIPKMRLKNRMDIFSELETDPLVQKITSANWNGSLVKVDAPEVTTKQLVSEVQLQMDEKGTSIAAASYSPSGCLSCDPDFKLRGPFGMILFDSETRTILSMGQILKLGGKPVKEEW